MKRIPIIAALILATVAIVSCSQGSGDNPYGKNILMTTIQVNASEDLIAASDIEITYWGKGGVQVTDTITSTYWKKKIVNDSFPTVIGYPEYRLLIKPDAKFDNDRCQLKLEILHMDKILNFGEIPISIDDIASSQVPAYLEVREGAKNLIHKHSDPAVYKVYINKDGKLEHDDYSMSKQSQEPSK